MADLEFLPEDSAEALFRWDARKEIGRGTFGVVYDAVCLLARYSEDFKGTIAGEHYAIKVLPKESLVIPEVHHEVGILRNLDSDYFIRLLYAFQDSHSVYLVEELFSSKHLHDLLKERRTLTERVAAGVTQQLIHALVCGGVPDEDQVLPQNPDLWMDAALFH
eukprot:RCo051057